MRSICCQSASWLLYHCFSSSKTKERRLRCYRVKVAVAAVKTCGQAHMCLWGDSEQAEDKGWTLWLKMESLKKKSHRPDPYGLFQRSSQCWKFTQNDKAIQIPQNQGKCQFTSNTRKAATVFQLWTVERAGQTFLLPRLPASSLLLRYLRFD